MKQAKAVVVAAMVERDGRFLLGRRSPNKATAPGVWCAVMGRVKRGETQEQAIVREVDEEVGLLVRPVERIWSADNRAGSAHIHWWWTATLDAAPGYLANPEHSELRWVTLEEMGGLTPVFDEDVRIFRRLAERMRRLPPGVFVPMSGTSKGGNAMPTKKKPAKARRYSKAASDKVGEVMHEQKAGKLRSGRSGKKVTSRKQAIAIGLSEARRAGKKVPAKKK